MNNNTSSESLMLSMHLASSSAEMKPESTIPFRRCALKPLCKLLSPMLNLPRKRKKFHANSLRILKQITELQEVSDEQIEQVTVLKLVDQRLEIEKRGFKKQVELEQKQKFVCQEKVEFVF